MTYDRDYILRMVREFAQFLARVVKSKDGESDGRTFADLDGAAQTFVGLGLETLRSLPTEQLVMMLSIGGGLDVNRAYAAGRLLESSADLDSRSGSPDDPQARKALHLLCETALSFGSYLNEEHQAALYRLEDRLMAGPAGALASDPASLARVLEVHVQAGDRERIRRLTAALAAGTDEREDPMRALRIHLRGGAPALVGRIQSMLEGDAAEEPGR